MTDRLPGGGPSAPAALLEFLAECGRATEAATGLAAAAGAAAELAVRHLPADLAGISMHDRQGEPQRLATTHDVLLRLDHQERQLIGSPRRTRLVQGEVLVVHDAATITPHTRWPEWCTAARDVGIGSALMLGLAPVRGRPVLLELYAEAPARFLELGSVVVGQIATFLGLGLRHADQRANLEMSLQSRGVIGQAQGILMERYNLTGEQAISYLRRNSQDSQTPIRDLAAEVVRDREIEAQERNKR